MAKLGKYTVPADESKAGANDSCRGGAEHGLQEDFFRAVSDFRKDLLDKDVHIDFGYSGYVSRASAEEWAKNGNDPFLKKIRHFGWGLALEYSGSPYVTAGVSGDRLSDARDVIDSLVTIARSQYGLNFYTVQENGVTKLTYVAPYYITYSEEASGVSYAGDDTDNSSGSDAGEASVSSVAYFFSNQFKSVSDDTMANMLVGERALANDEPLWKSVKTAVNSSLRSCMSGPNGEFLAWYPDYWGLYGNKTPHLVLEDIELIDLRITQSDDEYYSHVFTHGVDQGGMSIDYLHTMGVVSIESDTAARASSVASEEGEYVVSDEVSAILKELIYIPEGEEWRYTPKELYRRYGARPNTAPSTSAIQTLIETGTDEASGDTRPQYILPFLYALYEFMDHWANQYQATLTITFQPGLFPGCRIKVKSLDVSFYVKQVTHNMDYSSGFTTTVTCTCPVGSLVSGMVNPNGGGSDGQG